MKINLLCFIYTLITTFSAAVVNAQTGSLRIIVIDQNSDIIPGAVALLKKSAGTAGEISETDSKTILFPALEPGRYALEISAAGFQSYSANIEIKPGGNEFRIKLEIAEIKEDIEVESGAQRNSLDARSGAFSETLSSQQIEALPESPDEMKSRLQTLAGQDAAVLVDGFPENRLPPKSQIQSITIVRGSFDAEFHETGNTYVSIITRAGSSKWGGRASFLFNNDSLNARDYFALSRPESRVIRSDFSLWGPLIKDWASIWLAGTIENLQTPVNVFAILPEGQLSSDVRQPWSFIWGNARLSYNLAKEHPLNVSFSRIRAKRENLGIGGFNLPERSFNSKQVSNTFQISTSGPVGEKYLHEFRFQFHAEDYENVSVSDLPAIVVLDSFSRGGAGVYNNSTFRKLGIAENLALGTGVHLFKIGGLLEYENRQFSSANGLNGTFTFSGLNDFLLGRPAIFTQRIDTGEVRVNQTRLGLYIQDSIDLHKSFSLNLGVRYERQNDLSDQNNFAPRIAFYWSPQKKGQTVFRGGIGIYYDWLTPDNSAKISSSGINQPGEAIIINPGFPNPFGGESSLVLPRSFMRIADDLVNPYVIVSSLGVSRKLSSQSSFIATYKFERGVKQFRSRNVNAPDAGGKRPDANFGRIIQIESSAFFERNSLEINYRTSLTDTISLNANYTLAKVISDSDYIFDLPSDSNKTVLDRSFSDNDRRHQLYVSASWAIKSNLNFMLSYTGESAAPYSITTGFDDNNDTVFNDRPSGVRRNSERGGWQSNFDAYLRWTLPFNKLFPGGSSSGAAKTNGAGANQRKRYSVSFVANVSNLFNQTSFRQYVGVRTSPFFGQPVSSLNARRMNLSVEFNF